MKKSLKNQKKTFFKFKKVGFSTAGIVMV